ncbi:MAG: CHAT domain-containing protein [Vicinamibacterales bacterium]
MPLDDELPGLPPEFLTADSQVVEEAVVQPAAASRGRAAGAGGALELAFDLDPEHTAVLALRHASGALTFSLPVDGTSRRVRGSRRAALQRSQPGPTQVRFQVRLPQPATRGLAGRAVKAIVIKVAKVAGDKAVSLALPRLAEALENEVWKRRGLTEGWVRVAADTLAADAIAAATPVSPLRSLLFLHGSFSHTTAAFRQLAETDFFPRVKSVYDDRIFGFDHFSISRSPEQNARALLESLPAQTTTFDVVTHGRGGLVLRTIVERSREFGALSRRFKLGHAVLVASPNDGTPLASPQRWDDTIGWLANVLEMFPDNPFTTGSALVANGLVWLANHALGDLPGLHAMDVDGDVIKGIQSSPGPPSDAYSALVANYHPSGRVLQRLLDVGIDELFGSANDLVVPSEGGWRIDRSNIPYIPSARIGCFGPGGNLHVDTVTHLNFFLHARTVDFMVNALLGRPQPLAAVDPRKRLPDRRLRARGSTDAVPVPAKGTVVTGAAVERPEAAAPDEPTLRITVVNGDLTFEAATLLLGHYDATRLTGTEKIMDRLIGGTMDRSLAMGVYPVAIGSNQIFINNRPNLERGTFMPRPKAVLIAGLGEEGKLRAPDLVRSVRQAVIAWSQRLAEGKATAPRRFELASTLLGSGGTGVSAGQAARLIAEGVYQANMLLANNDAAESPSTRGAPAVSHLRFIELYLDRATDAWRALRLQEAARPGRYLIAEAVTQGTGALQRPADPGYRGAEFDFISVLGARDADGVPMISYTLDTRRARSEVRAQRAQSRLINELVATASNSQSNDQQIGRTLFGLLIPIELEAYLTGSGEVQIELDPQTAAIPWELLDTKRESDSDPPWAIKVNLLRKLRIREFRERVSDAGLEASALVIGEPECPPDFPRLYGARAEAIAVRDCLAGPAGLDASLVTALVSDEPTQSGPSAREVVNALFERPWRIMHIAGHGVPATSGNPAGVVLSNGTFLGSAEIESMRTVPELVFINCCHLGAADARQLLNTYNRAEFASGVAGALISIGVRCVIAAGWAVDDDGARVFAEAFYSSLLRGNRFIVSVGEARLAAYRHNPDQNTWAAYQCYGDPHWVFRQVASDPNRATVRPSEDFSGLASAVSLKLALERIIVEVRYQGADRAAKLDSLRQLESTFAAQWGARGDVAELFGEAFFEAGDIEAGLKWYQTAVTAPDGRASLRAIEQLGNLRSRLAWELVDHAARHLDAIKTREKAGGPQGKGRADTRRARIDAERALRGAVTRADALIDDSLALLGKAGAVEGTLERSSLIGSAYKRRALVHIAAGRRGQIDRDLELMAASYRQAQAFGEQSGDDDLFYPLSNRLVAEVALNAGRGRWRSLDRATVAILEQSLKASEPDFWSVVAAIELDQYQALAQRRLAAARPTLEKAYADLHRRVRSTKMWASVYDTACLTLPSYAARATGKEKAAAETLLVHLRALAYPPSE